MSGNVWMFINSDDLLVRGTCDDFASFRRRLDHVCQRLVTFAAPGGAIFFRGVGHCSLDKKIGKEF